MRLDRDAAGELMVGEGGHSESRIVHSDGDATGRELHAGALDRVLELERTGSPLRVFENCFAPDLITASNDPGGRW